MRDKVIGIRVSPTELKLLERFARANDLAVATAVRREALRAAREVVERGRASDRAERRLRGEPEPPRPAT